MVKPIPVTVFTGFLGAGKTTTILSLLPQASLSLLPKDYKVVLLKNEFGDVQVDSQLAKQSSLTAVSEILNGCMCCILVGQMKNALLEIKDSFSPDRIIIEASGSAFPATLALQIRALEQETNGAFKLDAIATVIDAENFTGYEDTSTTARMQAAYTDVLLINKWELVSERQLDIVMDHLFTLNELTPKIKCSPRSGTIDPALIFGLDSKLFATSASEKEKAAWAISNHHDEVETVTVRRTGIQTTIPSHIHDESCNHEEHSDLVVLSNDNSHSLTSSTLSTALATLNKETVYRVKGFIRLVPTSAPDRDGHSTPFIENQILNWAFGRFELTPIEHNPFNEGEDILFTVMGERGEVRAKAQQLANALGGTMS